MKPGWRAAALLPILIAVTLLSGCGGGGAGSEFSDKSCTLQEYNKSNLPALPGISVVADNPLYYQQWAIHYDRYFYYGNDIDDEASIHMSEEHRFLGRGVKVAVIDDGLDVDHEDLVGAVVATYDVATGMTDVRPTRDTQNHGTEVTGIIAARNNAIGLLGVAPEAEVYFIRLPFGRSVSTFEIVEAFEKAKEWGVDVINCSWGSGDVDPAVRDIIADLATHGRNGKGTVIVFAAGNEDQPIGKDEASLPEVIAVGATNRENLRSSYSNYGESLDIMAPGGEYIGLTTLDQMGSAGLSSRDPDYLEYDDPYNAFGGTSASAPIVTGVVALLLEANPNLTRQNVQNVLACSADKIGRIPYGGDGFNDYYGYGKVNLKKAMALVR
ncbi:S8 family serine peptidase [Hydrogenimonas sp.]|uniref:S8 family serine peptidase n=1 Tax=Hydrogenimonas sp. TaxID=2231112 RepID=UPI00262D02AC|nr:S8 family serine peptidase [Hydrogenimonas sp.]